MDLVEQEVLAILERLASRAGKGQGSLQTGEHCS